MLDQAFHAAETGRASEDFCVRGDYHCSFASVLSLEGKHSAKHRHLPCGNLMSRVRLQPGIMDSRGLWVPGEKISDPHRVLRVRPQSPWDSAHAAQDQPAIERRRNCSAFVLNAADALEKIVFIFRHNNSAENVTMTAKIFCR